MGVMRQSLDLPPRQRQVYEFVREAVRRRGVAPSLREISDAFGWATEATSVYHLKALERRGLIVRQSAAWRDLALAEDLRLRAWSERLARTLNTTPHALTLRALSDLAARVGFEGPPAVES